MIDHVEMKQIGNSEIYVMLDTTGIARLRMPVPPSTNRRQTIGYKKTRAGFGYSKTPILVKTTEARLYDQYSLFVSQALMSINHTPVSTYIEVYFTFFLSNMRYDTHNGLKIACDVLEKAGLVTNDRYILPQIRRPEKAPSDPRMVIEFWRGE